MRTSFIGKKSSKARRAISENTGIPLYRGGVLPDLFINYGLAGVNKQRFYKRYPKARKVPTVNKNAGIRKYAAVQRASKAGILTPKSVLSLSKNERLPDWLEKKEHSIGGKGIKKATRRSHRAGWYYQEFIKNRAYELRVHAFSWMPTWVVQKRLGNAEQVAWNHANGGYFQTVHHMPKDTAPYRAVEMSRVLLDVLGMSFGAADFIVDAAKNVYFIEINSAPGFSGLSDSIYFEAFAQLKKTPKRKASEYV